MTVDELPTIRQQVQYTGGAPLCISEIPGNVKTISLTKWAYANTDGSTDIYKAYWWKSAALELNPGQSYLCVAAYSIAVDELASHRHYASALKNNGSATHTDPGTDSAKQKFESADIVTDKYDNADNPPIWNWWGRTKTTGDDKPHNNIQPCKAVYIWVRAA